MYLHKTVGKTCSPRRNADEWSPLFSSHVSLLLWIHISDSYESQPGNKNKEPPPWTTWHTKQREKKSSQLMCTSKARSIDCLVKRHRSEENLWAWQPTLGLEKRWGKTPVYKEQGGAEEKSSKRALHRMGWTVSHRELPMQVCGWHRLRLLHSWKASAALAHLSTSYHLLQRVELLKVSVDTALSAFLMCVCVCAADFSTGSWDTLA